MQDLADEQIVHLVLGGNTNAFEELIKRYNNRIFSIGMRLFRNEDDAGDFTQEVFIRAFDKLPLYRFISPFQHWLVKLAYNFGINQVKSKKITTDIEDSEISVSENHVAHIENREIADILNSAIRKLPPEYQICIDLFFFWGLKLTAIAAITDIPVNTVKSNVRRGKMLLRDYLRGTIAEDYNEMF